MHSIAQAWPGPEEIQSRLPQIVKAAILWRRILVLGFSFSLFAFVSPLKADCLNFPSTLVPLSSVSYVTAANSSGDQLVVGILAGGLNTLSQFGLPDSTNQVYCDAAVQLAPGQFYPNVYVPTTLERSGNFSAFAGLLVNPATNQPYPKCDDSFKPACYGLCVSNRADASESRGKSLESHRFDALRGLEPCGCLTAQRSYLIP